MFNSAASSPLCQSSGSGDDITPQEGSGGLRVEGGAWHGVGRPPSSLPPGLLRKQVAAPEQRLRKRVRGSAFLTPQLPHVHSNSCYPLFSVSLFTSCSHFSVILCLTICLALPAPFHYHPVAHRCSNWLVGGKVLRISSVRCLFDLFIKNFFYVNHDMNSMCLHL